MRWGKGVRGIGMLGAWIRVVVVETEEDKTEIHWRSDW